MKTSNTLPFFTIFVTISLIFIVLGSFYLSIKNSNIGYRHFGQQTQSFLQGKTDIPKDVDTVNFNGKYYWHQAPLPSVLLAPFQLIFGSNFNEFPSIFILAIILISYLYKIIRLKKYSRLSSFYLIVAFIFGSVVENLILHPVSWYLSQMLATTLLTIAIYEFETKKRYAFLGILTGCLIATRITAAPIGLLIFFYILQKPSLKKNPRLFLKNILTFFAPILISCILLLWFNQIRFGVPFFDTYKASESNPLLATAKEIGLFSLSHIPSNLYYGFLTTVIPVTAKNDPNLVFPYITYGKWGVSFFLICPFFLYALKSLQSKNWLIRGYWLTILITLIPLLTYYGFSGFFSFGPRYVADFLPILFMILLSSLRSPKLSKLQISIILVSASFNTYLLLSPHLISK